MNRILILSVLFCALPLSVMAQDDLYFTPKKSVKKEQPAKVTYHDYAAQEPDAYYCGSDRDVDEYNRHGRFVSSIDSLGTDSLANDIIDFESGGGNDSLAVKYGYYDDDDAFRYSRRIGLYEDGLPWGPAWSLWYDPWYYGSWYDPWYYGYWYDPWFYGGWAAPYNYAWRGPYYGVSIVWRYGSYGRRIPHYRSSWYSTAYRNGDRYSRNRYYTDRSGNYRDNNRLGSGGRSRTGIYSSGNVNRGYRRGESGASSTPRSGTSVRVRPNNNYNNSSSAYGYPERHSSRIASPSGPSYSSGGSSFSRSSSPSYGGGSRGGAVRSGGGSHGGRR